MLEILVTGSGRCGTGFVAKLLTSAGCRCTHEQIFNPNGWDHAVEQMRMMDEHPEWKWRGESSWCAAVYLDRPALRDVTVVHLVRHPKQVLDSCLRRYKFNHPYYGPYYHWLAKHLPGLDEQDTPEGKAAYRYLRLNELVEKRADIFHQVEHDPKELLAKLDIDWQGYGLFNNTEYNAHPGGVESDVRLDDLPVELQWPIAKMSTKYGYEW